MTTELRVVMIIISVLVLIYVMVKIRKSVLNVPDSIFWIVFALLLIVLSIFPQIAFFFAMLLGFETPLNFLLLLFIALAFLKLFLVTIKQSELNEKIKTMAQKVAFDEFDRKKDDGNE